MFKKTLESKNKPKKMNYHNEYIEFFTTNYAYTNQEKSSDSNIYNISQETDKKIGIFNKAKSNAKRIFDNQIKILPKEELNKTKNISV